MNEVACTPSRPNAVTREDSPDYLMLSTVKCSLSPIRLLDEAVGEGEPSLLDFELVDDAQPGSGERNAASERPGARAATAPVLLADDPLDKLPLHLHPDRFGSPSSQVLSIKKARSYLARLEARQARASAHSPGQQEEETSKAQSAPVQPDSGLLPTRLSFTYGNARTKRAVRDTAHGGKGAQSASKPPLRSRSKSSFGTPLSTNTFVSEWAGTSKEAGRKAGAHLPQGWTDTCDRKLTVDRAKQALKDERDARKDAGLSLFERLQSAKKTPGHMRGYSFSIDDRASQAPSRCSLEAPADMTAGRLSFSDTAMASKLECSLLASEDQFAGKENAFSSDAVRAQQPVELAHELEFEFPVDD